MEKLKKKKESRVLCKCDKMMRQWYVKRIMNVRDNLLNKKGKDKSILDENDEKI